MSDPTIPMLVAYAESLKNLEVSSPHQELPLQYAKIFLRRAIEEGGRRTMAELRSDTLKELWGSFEVNCEVFHALLLNYVLLNDNMNIVIPEDSPQK